jgi:hypothetical protein
MNHNYLDRSERINHQLQSLLFNESDFCRNRHSAKQLPADFYSRGYTLIDRIGDYRQAHDLLYDLFADIKQAQTLVSKDSVQRLQLAKFDLIPVCDEIVQTGFQALHFDMGQPFLPEERQTLYAFGALYRPPGERNPNAKTRILNIQELFTQKSFGSAEDIRTKLQSYIQNYGDGWINPSPHNTHRLACFARLADAISGRNQLCQKIDTMIGQCFFYDKTPSGIDGLKQEEDFFRELGLHITTTEDQIEILPGQMLIYDNMRCVHGRIGKRKQKELFNFLFGIKEVSKSQIQSYQDWIISTCV